MSIFFIQQSLKKSLERIHKYNVDIPEPNYVSDKCLFDEYFHDREGTSCLEPNLGNLSGSADESNRAYESFKSAEPAVETPVPQFYSLGGKFMNVDQLIDFICKEQDVLKEIPLSKKSDVYLFFQTTAENLERMQSGKKL